MHELNRLGLLIVVVIVQSMRDVDTTLDWILFLAVFLTGWVLCLWNFEKKEDKS